MSFRDKFGPVVTVLGTNAVPLAGYFGARWSAEQTMIVYLCENFAISLLAALKVRILAPREGKGGDGKVVTRGSLLGAFLLVALMFSIATAFFLFFFVFGVLEPKIDRDQVVHGLIGIGVFQAFGFVYDLFAMRNARMPDAEKLLEQALGRVFLLCLCVCAGMGLALFFDQWFVVPFIVLKAVVDVATTVTQWKSLLQSRTR